MTKPAAGSTPNVLPRPDFHFPGEIGRTYLDSDPAQFPPCPSSSQARSTKSPSN
jgi:hypothetical protein